MRSYGDFFPLTALLALGALVSSGVMNPMERLGGGGGAASSSAVESTSSAILR